jgi:hypothetical protein
MHLVTDRLTDLMQLRFVTIHGQALARRIFIKFVARVGGSVNHPDQVVGIPDLADNIAQFIY